MERSSFSRAEHLKRSEKKGREITRKNDSKSNGTFFSLGISIYLQPMEDSKHNTFKLKKKEDNNIHSTCLHNVAAKFALFLSFFFAFIYGLTVTLIHIFKAYF